MMTENNRGMMAARGEEKCTMFCSKIGRRKIWGPSVSHMDITDIPNYHFLLNSCVHLLLAQNQNGNET